MLQQLRTEQQEEALRRQQEHLQRSLLGVAFKKSSTSRGASNSNKSCTDTLEPCCVVVNQVEEAQDGSPLERPQQHQPVEQEQQQEQDMQQEIVGLGTPLKASYSPVDCCFITTSDNSDSSSSAKEARTPVRVAPGRIRGSATAAAAASAAVDSLHDCHRLLGTSELETPERRIQTRDGSSPVLTGQLQQLRSVLTPESQASTPLLRTPLVDRVQRMQTTDNGNSIKGSHSNKKRKRSAAGLTAGAADCGKSPMTTQRNLEEFLPGGARSPQTLLKEPQQQCGSTTAARGRLLYAAAPVTVAAAGSSLPNVISLLTQNIDSSSSEMSSQLPSQLQQQERGDCCCGAAGSNGCCCDPEKCIKQCLLHIFPLCGAPHRLPLSVRIPAAAQPVMQLLLLHAAATGANAASLEGKSAHVVAAVSSRIAAAAADNGTVSPLACIHQAQPPGAAATGTPSVSTVNKGISERRPTDRDASSYSIEHVDAPAATGSAAPHEIHAAAASGQAQVPSSKLSDPVEQPEDPVEKPPEEEAAAVSEAAYWECVAAALEGFGGVLTAVIGNLVAVGAHEERQLLVRALLRLLQNPGARTAVAAGAAATVAAVPADVRKEATGEDCSSRLTLLLLRLLVCSAGRLLWPLLLHRAQDAFLSC